MNKPNSVMIYGKHAALAAMQNPERKIRRVVVTKNTQKELGRALDGCKQLQVAEGKQLAQIVGAEAVHQGIVVECSALPTIELEGWLKKETGKTLLFLDQVTDPHNVGAILRSAAAFDVGAVITTERHAPRDSGVMAKTASGGLEIVPLISVTNLVSAMKECKEAGYWIYGLDGAADKNLSHMKLDTKTALVLGAEGAGLRRLTTEHCDFLVKLPMSGQMESLNVSNAAAVALYDIFRRIDTWQNVSISQ